MSSVFAALKMGLKITPNLFKLEKICTKMGLSTKMLSTNSTPKTYFTKRPFLEVDHIVNSDRQHLHCKYWKPTVDVRFLILMIHGFGGHCARFEELSSHFSSQGGLVFAHDHIGHGESEGNRTTVKHYSLFIRDILQHIDVVKARYPELPLFLFGQSMGGALAVLTAHKRPDLFRGIVVHGGMLMLDPQMKTPFNRFAIRLAAAIMPDRQLTSFGSDGATRDDEQMKIISKDPFLVRGIKSHMALQLLLMAQEIGKIGKDFSSPFLAVHGEKDTVCHPDGSRWLHQNAKSFDKSLKIYDGCYHDVIHELPDDRKRCINDIGDWVSARLPG